MDIEDYTKQCQECIKRSQVTKEPLQPHDTSEGPWRKLGIDYFAFDGNSYVLICDYFSKFPFLYRAKTSFWSLRDRLIDLFSIEGYPDEIVSDNGPPFQSKEFAKFLSGLGIKHTTSSPGYPRSNGFIERHIQTVKNMLSKSSNTRFFQEVLADLRTTRIGTGLPSPAEILHGRNLTTRVQAEINIKAIHSVLQERQLKKKRRRGEVEEEYVELGDEDNDPDYNPTKDPEQEFEEEDTYLDDEETFEIEKHVHAINLQEAGDYVVEIRRFVSYFAKVVRKAKTAVAREYRKLIHYMREMVLKIGCYGPIEHADEEAVFKTIVDPACTAW